MNKLFSQINFFIFLIAIVLLFVTHLMYGSCQTSKLHYLVQVYYIPDYLPNWMSKYEKIPHTYAVPDKSFSGKWFVWYRSGKKRYEINYIDGKEEGKWTGWHENGAKEYEGDFKDGKLNGKEILWYENGIKRYETEFKDEKKNGRDTHWEKNGKKTIDLEWKDGDKIKDYLDPVRSKNSSNGKTE